MGALKLSPLNKNETQDVETLKCREVVFIIVSFIRRKDSKTTLYFSLE